LLVCCMILCVFLTFCSFIQVRSPISQKYDPFLADYNGADVLVEATAVIHNGEND